MFAVLVNQANQTKNHSYGHSHPPGCQKTDNGDLNPGIWENGFIALIHKSELIELKFCIIFLGDRVSNLIVNDSVNATYKRRQRYDKTECKKFFQINLILQALGVHSQK